jgi:hypothetical protein
MDYLTSPAGMSQTFRTKIGMKKDMHKNSNEEFTATPCEWRTVDLLDRLQNETHRGEGDAADHSARGRMILRTERKQVTSTMKKV